VQQHGERVYVRVRNVYGRKERVAIKCGGGGAGGGGKSAQGRSAVGRGGARTAAIPFRRGTTATSTTSITAVHCCYIACYSTATTTASTVRLKPYARSVPGHYIVEND